MARKATPEPRWDLPYTGFVSFLRSPTCTDLDRLDADIAVLGVPSDEGSPWKPGARFAPRKIRELSVQFAGRGTVDDPDTFYRPWQTYQRYQRGPEPLTEYICAENNQILFDNHTPVADKPDF